MNKRELMDAMKNARSWREVGVSVQEAYEILSQSCHCGSSGCSMGTAADRERVKEVATINVDETFVEDETPATVKKASRKSKE